MITAGGNALTPGEKDPCPASGCSTDGRERALLTRIAARDETAMKELYLLYHPRLAGFLTRLTARPELAEATINDTFWVVWNLAGEFRGNSRVSTWIFGITYRRGLKTLRDAGRPPTDAVVGSEAATAEPAQQKLDEWPNVALHRLPFDQRMAIALAYNVGHSCEEIASIMQCIPNTVKTHLFHARRKLKTPLTHLAGPS